MEITSAFCYVDTVCVYIHRNNIMYSGIHVLFTLRILSFKEDNGRLYFVHLPKSNSNPLESELKNNTIMGVLIEHIIRFK